MQDAGLPCSPFHRQGPGLTAISGGSTINCPTFVLVLRPEKGVDAVRALRVALKFLLRRFGLRVVKISEVRNQYRYRG